MAQVVRPTECFLLKWRCLDQILLTAIFFFNSYAKSNIKFWIFFAQNWSAVPFKKDGLFQRKHLWDLLDVAYFILSQCEYSGLLFTPQMHPTIAMLLCCVITPFTLPLKRVVTPLIRVICLPNTLLCHSNASLHLFKRVQLLWLSIFL